MQFSQSYSKHPFLRCFTVKEDESRTLWLDTQSHASSNASSADDDYSWQWPTSFWSQFKVSTLWECFQQLPDTMPFYSLKRSLTLFDDNDWHIILRGKEREAIILCTMIHVSIYVLKKYMYINININSAKNPSCLYRTYHFLSFIYFGHTKLKILFLYTLISVNILISI